MGQITLMRTLGVLSISFAVVSFLYEGWETFNGLEKFLIFLGFSTVLFVLSEALKTFSKEVSKIFGMLFISITPAIFAQLGAFLLDDEVIKLPNIFTPSPLPDNSPVKFICIVTSLQVCLILLRLLSRFKTENLPVSMTHFILSGVLFTIPLRTPEYHAIASFSIFCTFILFSKKGQLRELSVPSNLGIAFVPLLIFLGRAILYPTNSAFMISIWTIVAGLGFLKIPKLMNDSESNTFNYTVGAVGVILLCHEIANYGFWTSYMWTIVLIEGVFLLLAAKIEESRKTLTFFIIFFAGYNFLKFWLSSEAITVSTVSVHIGLPVLLTIACYTLKQGPGIMVLGTLSLFSMAFFTMRLITLPVVNAWMVFGVLGVVLLILSSVVEKPHQRLLELWRKIKDSLEQ